MNLKEKIKNHDDFSLKFNDAPFSQDTGFLNPGWAEPTYDDFFERMVDVPVLLNQSTVLPMTALQHDLDMLTADVELDSQRDANGRSTPLTETELEPGMERKQLIAQPLHFERWGLFSDPNGTIGTGEGSGYKMTTGILPQLKAIASDTNKEAQGIAKLVYKDHVGQGILDAIETYIDQDGNIKKATCVLPPQIYAKLMIEIARDKETDLGDAVFQDGNITKILGIEITADDILRNTRNGYDRMQFTDGVYKGNGTYVDKMKYGFIGQPANIVFGMMREFDIKNQWDIDVLGYKVALLCKGDVKVLWDQDTLAIPFTRNNQ